MIQQIEERSLNAWPGVRSLLYDGWLLRFAGGYTRRANSISPLFSGHEDVGRKIAWCESQYAMHDLPAVFKLTPNIHPAELDAVLAQHGYRLEAETTVMYAPLTEMPALTFDRSAVMLPQADWLAHFAHITGQSSEAQCGHRAILEAIILTACLVAIIRDGQAAAIGMGVLERGMVGLYDMVTAEPFRRQGLATQVISTILTWAAENRATGAYLNVLSNNAPALALYRKMGYRPCYQYWYRIQQQGV
jgi:N-acetylglutamate synthase